MESSQKSIMDNKLLMAGICILVGIIMYYVIPAPYELRHSTFAANAALSTQLGGIATEAEAAADEAAEAHAVAQAALSAAPGDAAVAAAATAAFENYTALRAEATAARADAAAAAGRVVAPANRHGWRLFAIFMATIVALIVQPLPMISVALISIAVVAATGTRTIGQALGGFQDATIWLIVGAFFISRGFIKTGLGSRIAYMFMMTFGKKSLTLAYSLTAANLVMGPAMPSNTARCGGVLAPIARSLANLYDSKVEDGTERRLGSFLAFTTFQADIVVCAMFMTAMAANPMAVDLAYNAIGLEITWAGWFVAAVVPGMLNLILIPLVIYKLYPPEIKDTPAATQLAKDRLKDMGPLTKDEKWMMFVFVLLLFLWVTGGNFNAWFGIPNIAATTTAFIGISVLLCAGVLTGDDIKSEKTAWDTLVWFSALVMMAGQLNTLGVIGWFSGTVANAVAHMDWVMAFLIIALAYFYSHYFFASATAHVAAMYVAMLTAAVAIGTPPMFAGLVLAFFSNIFMGITHYGTGNAPPWFGMGYVKLGTWWGYAFILSVMNIVIWVGVGGLWWRVIGLW